MCDRYGLDPATVLHKLENPAIISFPLAIITAYVVSLMSQKNVTEEKILTKEVVE